MASCSEINLSVLAHGYRIDSEFYKQEYLDKDIILGKFESKTLGALGKVTDGEHGSVKLLKDGIKYLTAENIKNGYVDVENVRYVSKAVDDRNARARVNVNDILISIKGTLGQIGIAEEWLLPANMNRDVAIIKLHTSEFYKFFVAVFLQTKYGLYQLSREGSGGVQQMITLGRLREVKIPHINEYIQNQCAEMYIKSLSLKQLSKALYYQAQELLEKELGLDKLVIERAKNYETNFSEVVSKHRVDADHYQYQYNQIKNLIKNYRSGFIRLLQIVDALSPNINPKKTPALDYKYVELSNINPTLGIIEGHKKVKGESAPSRAKREVSLGDIIASAVVGSIDKAGIVDETKVGALASTGFFHFRTKGYSPYYLLLLIRSKVVQMQLLQEATGGILSAVPDNKLKNIIVPNVEESVQNELSELVKASHKAKEESDQLLEQAKKRVENLIEGVIEQ